MKRYQFLYTLLLAAFLCTFSVPISTLQASTTTVELTNEKTPTAHECLILKAAAEASQQNYRDLYDGFVRGSVAIVALPDNHYCVVYGADPSDFIVIEDLEEA